MVRKALATFCFVLRNGLKSLDLSKLGRVAEWFKAPVLKTGVPARVPWVRIPPLPPKMKENPIKPEF